MESWESIPLAEVRKHGSAASEFEELAMEAMDSETRMAEFRKMVESTSRIGKDIDIMPKDPLNRCFVLRTYMFYTGAGWLMSMAYLDPGNLSADIHSGAYTGYSQLWVLLACHFVGGLFQTLSARLAVSTGRDLAQICRASYPKVVWFFLFVMIQIVIIGANIQEVIGTATALNFLFGIKLWVGAVATGCSTFLFLSMNFFGKRPLEFMICSLVFVMLFVFSVNWFVEVPPAQGIFSGFVPLCPDYAIMQMVGTAGAVIMPHNFFLHSGLVLYRGVNRRDREHIRQANRYFLVDTIVALIISFLINLFVVTSFGYGFFNATCAANTGDGGSLGCWPMSASPGEGCADDACLPCSTPSGQTGYCNAIGLSQVGEALEAFYMNGRTAPMVFALGLLAAGQASTITCSVAGVFVFDGFLDWKVAEWKRVLLNRSVSLIPSIVVSFFATGDPTWSQWLNVLQSAVLPFALMPLITFSSDPAWLGEFALPLRMQILCYALALLVVGINFYLISQQFTDLPFWQDWCWSWLSLGYVLYAMAIVAVMWKDIKRVTRFLRGVNWRQLPEDFCKWAPCCQMGSGLHSKLKLSWSRAGGSPKSPTVRPG